ncbi:MAG TPA: peptidylprolyl isomerase [Bacteroidales bacterium]|nr:peptidylprolyl isomerase [Bacteroidales bacterium]HQP04355.1 peptidylprolyl isomerase [Bacteroidales bacterium]
MLFICLLLSTSVFSQTTKVLIKTSKGDITVMLYDDTPLHRDNFIKLVNESYYNDVLFHRVIKQFMIQAGDPDSRNAPAGKMLGNGGPGYTIAAEFVPTHIHKKGALAAARTGDNMNPEKRSSGSQFYIVQGQVFTDMQLDSYEKQLGKVFTKEQRDAYCTVGGAPHLDGAYTVFGEVTDGLDVIDKIAAVETNKANRPLEDVKIISVSIIK